jgi:diguanylate cyclase (GGDEF)-like protein
MNALVHSLATMSGLRDRDTLDFALVRLVLDCTEGAVRSAWLARVVGEGDERRCLTLARLAVGQSEPVRDVVWSDWSLLPRLSDYALHSLALNRGRPVHSESAPFIGVLPLPGPQGAAVLLEIGSAQPLTPHMLDLVHGILLTYQNLLGLLDYGEKDALTELLNRKTFDGAFFKATAGQHAESGQEGPDRRAVHESQESGVWLAVLDIDHFKRVNDNFGHLIGDEVLLLLARLMRANSRFHDQLYRFGGEEFVILMRCDSVGHAHAVLERLRARVQEYAFPQVGTITVSIGFSALLPNDTPSSAFGRADKAVYHAKEHGRNQVCNYQDLVASGQLVEQAVEDMDVDLF